jgi:uncharacterized protein (DUF1499 family)
VKPLLRRGLICLAAAAFCGLVVMALSSGTEFGFWQRIGALTGTRPDLGPVDFQALTRRSSPNDALACPQGACPQGRADIDPPVYTSPAARLKERLRAALAQEARVTELAPVSDLHLRFVQRSFLMRYPDVVDVEFLPRSSGSATLAIYSRSAVGHSDLGVNRARIERWLELMSR